MTESEESVVRWRVLSGKLKKIRNSYGAECDRVRVKGLTTKQQRGPRGGEIAQRFSDT